MKPIPFNALAKMFGTYHRSQNLVQGVAIDSRLIHPGDLFFALPGKKVDGGSFIGEAALKGAVGAVVQKGFSGDSAGLPLLAVDDVLAQLQQLARQVLATRKTRVVAITGSVGKTTTKEFAATLLGTCYKVAKSPLSYNSQATLPLSILRANGHEDILVLEMGMSEPGQIKQLLSIASPDVAVLTKTVLQHATAFPEGLLGIAKEKGSIFSHPKTKIGIFHHEYPLKGELEKESHFSKRSFSLESQEATYFLHRSETGVKILAHGESSIEMKLHLPLKAHFENFLAATAVARAFDVPWHDIEGAIHLLELPPSRFEQVEKEGICFINDAYNANPESTAAALKELPTPKKGGKKVAVLGEMNDLGLFTEQGHERVAYEALKAVDLLFCVGERSKAMQKIWEQNKREVFYFEKPHQVEKPLQKHLSPGDVVLLKGARALALDQLLKNYNK